MADLLFWTLLRILIVAMPLAVALLSVRRAFLSVSNGRGRSAPVWMAFAGFAAVSGASLLPWAMHLQPVNGAGLMLSALSVTLWPLLGALLRRPPAGYRRAGMPTAPVFRHASADPEPFPVSRRAPSRPARAADRAHGPDHGPDLAGDLAGDLALPFLPPARRQRLH